MAFFTIAGEIKGRLTFVTWADGELDGDREAVGRVLEAVDEGSSVGMTPTGPFYVAALKPIEAAVATILSVFDPAAPVDVTGEVPGPPDLPSKATP